MASNYLPIIIINPQAARKKLYDKKLEWQERGDIKDKQIPNLQLKGRVDHEQKMAC